MIRHDEHFLQLIHKHISLERFSDIQNLPFFYLEMPEKWMIGPRHADLNCLLELMPKDLTLEDTLPFPEFSFIMANEPSLHVVRLINKDSQRVLLMNDYFLPRSYDYSGDSYLKSGKPLVPGQVMPTAPERKQINRGLWVHYHARTFEGNYTCLIQQFYNRKCKMKIDLNNYHSDATPDVKTSVKDVLDRNNADMEAMMLSILALFYTAEEKHEHLVRVTRDPTRRSHQRGNHHPSKYSPHHHYVYLDGPPAKTLNTKEHGESVKRRGHARKAHWHRLMHDRFKNHPDFGKRIRIRASWIGPKEWADAGKIYTLHEPDTL